MRWLLAGQFCSILGDRIQYLALVAVLAERTSHFRDAHSGQTLGGLAVALLLPSALLSPVVAGYLDRWPRRAVMVWADAARAALMLGLAAVLPRVPLFGVFSLVLLGAVANVFFLPARTAIVAELVDASELNSANALGLLAAVLATLAGTLLGGSLLARTGTRGALALDGVSFAVSLGTLLRLPRGAAPAAPSGAASRSAWPGAAAFRALLGSERTALAAGLLVLTWVMGALLHVCGTLRLQGLTSRVTDLLAPVLAAVGAGGVVGAVVAGGRLAHRRSLKAGAGMAVCALALAAFALSTSVAWLLAAAFCAGAASVPLYILSDTELQEAIPAGMRGGAMAARDFLCKAGFLGVALTLGRTTGAATAAPALLVGAAFLLAAGLHYASRKPLRN